MTAILGLLLGILSGVMTGSFSLPMKKTTQWSWEATWLVWSVFALLIIPWTIAFATVPNLFSVFAQAKPSDIILVFVFGLLWGLGAVFFGQSISMIGISISFALCIGIATALGTLIPMLKDPGVFLTSGGIWSLGGIAVIVVAVTICAIAGRLREIQQQSSVQGDTANPDNKKTGKMMLGITLGALGGILSSLLNFAFNFSQSIKDSARDLGASESSSADPVWAITLLGGLMTNVIYCSILLSRNKTWSDYGKKKITSHWFLAALMGAIWMPSIALYGRAAVMMGELGSSAGWGFYMGMVIIISNIWGFITGEWRGIKGKPIRLMMVGIFLLLVAISLIGYGATR